MEYPQIANEYGMCGSDKQYLHELAAAVRGVLGRRTIVYTTDPPWLLDKGSIAGPEVFTCASTPAASLCPRLRLGACASRAGL